MQKPLVYIVKNGSFTIIKRVVLFSKLNELDILAINKGNEIISPGSSIGRAKLWRCLGYKFKSYLGQFLAF
jgi:hypothetical protein